MYRYAHFCCFHCGVWSTVYHWVRLSTLIKIDFISMRHIWNWSWTWASEWVGDWDLFLFAYIMYQLYIGHIISALTFSAYTFSSLYRCSAASSFDTGSQPHRDCPTNRLGVQNTTCSGAGQTILSKPHIVYRQVYTDRSHRPRPLVINILDILTHLISGHTVHWDSSIERVSSFTNNGHWKYATSICLHQLFYYYYFYNRAIRNMCVK